MGDAALAMLLAVVLAVVVFAGALARAGILAVTLRKPSPRKPTTTMEDPK